jgi:hypothetical protein
MNSDDEVDDDEVLHDEAQGDECEDDAMVGEENMVDDDDEGQVASAEVEQTGPLDWSTTADTDADLEAVNAAGSEHCEAHASAQADCPIDADGGTTEGASALITRPQLPGLNRSEEYCTKSIAHDDPAAAIMGSIFGKLGAISMVATDALAKALVNSPNPLKAMKELQPHVNLALRLTHETEKLANMCRRIMDKPAKKEEKP